MDKFPVVCLVQMKMHEKDIPIRDRRVETCGMVEQMSSDEILAGITGDPMWADNCEDVAFNTYPAAVMPDFKVVALFHWSEYGGQ